MVKSEASSNKSELAERLRTNLAMVRGLRPAAVESEAPLRMRLREWQSERFLRTYPDLMASKRYRPAAEFFLSDLYGPKDFSRRDEELERVLPLVTRVLPASAVHTLALGMELDVLSESFDSAMTRALRAGCRSAKADIGEASYASAYRACSNRPGREAQIALLIQIGEALDHVTRKPLLKAAIALIKRPAYATGLSALHDFLDRGFHAFCNINGAGEFLDIIRTRETLILERLFAGHPTPFDLERA